MENESAVLFMGVPVEVIHPLGIEKLGATLYPVYDVAFADQKLGQIGAVLPCDAGDECNF